MEPPPPPDFFDELAGADEDEDESFPDPLSLCAVSMRSRSPAKAGAVKDWKMAATAIDTSDTSGRLTRSSRASPTPSSGTPREAAKTRNRDRARLGVHRGS